MFILMTKFQWSWNISKGKDHK